MMFINYARLQASGCDFVSGKTLEAGWPVHKDTISFCKPKTIIHLVLNMVLQMLLKILLCYFFRASIAKEQLEYLTSDFYLLPSTTAKQQVIQPRGTCFCSLEKHIQTQYIVFVVPIQFHTSLMLFFFIQEVSKKIRVWLSCSSLYCTMVLLGQIGLGMIQGCQTDVEMTLDLNHIQLVMGVSPGGKKQCFLIYKLQII